MQDSTENTQQLFAEASHRDIRFVVFVATILGVLTLYFLSLNVYVLLRDEPPTYELEVEAAGDPNLRAMIAVVWDSDCGTPDVIRPRLLVDDGEQIRELSSDLLVPPGKPLELRVDIPRGCTPCRHEGFFRLTEISGQGTASSSHEVPIDIEVRGGWLRPFWIFLSWLAVMAVAMVVVYGVCLLCFPPPSGRLFFDDRTDLGLVSRPFVALRMRRSAWLLPWRRSTLPLAYIWKRAKIRAPLRSVGEVLFFTSTMPALLLFSGRKTSWRKRFPDVRMDRVPLLDCRTVEIFRDAVEYCHLDPDGRVDIAIRYKRT
jgi:hypothetical protein